MDIASVLREMPSGRFPAGIYSDAEVFELERERLFSRTWQFLAHESELPAPGDFVVRRILDDSFIVSRSGDGEVNVLLNMCRHRGMQVCRAEAGHQSSFRCPYHAWTYRNDGKLIGVPFHQEAYDASFDRAAHGLVRPPRVETYRGLIFANLDPGAAPLADALGDFAFFLDFYVHQSDAGIELLGPQRWRVGCNWKIGAENFCGDSYHTPHTHASVVDIELFREPKASKRKEGALYFAGGGGGTTYKLPHEGFDENLAYVGYPPEMVERMRSAWCDEQRDLVGPAKFMVSAATVFPNLSLVHNWPKVAEGGDDDVVPFISLRVWQPVSATETECLSWFAVDAGAPDAFKAASYKAYLMCFGSSGMFEQDDVENWTSITSVARGRLGASVVLDSTMGMAADGGTVGSPPERWPAPGSAVVGFGEYNQRAWLDMWAAHLTG